MNPTVPATRVMEHSTIHTGGRRPAMDAPTSVSRSTDTVAATPPASTAHRASGIGMSRLRYWATSHPLDGRRPTRQQIGEPGGRDGEADHVPSGYAGPAFDEQAVLHEGVAEEGEPFGRECDQQPG